MSEFSEDITLRRAQDIVGSWISDIGGGYFSPLTNMAILAEETGEVARAIARLYGDQKPKPGDNLNLADELADVLWVLCAIANQTGVDLSDALKSNIEKKTLRDKTRFKKE